MAVGGLADLPKILQAEWHADWLCGPTLTAAQLTSPVCYKKMAPQLDFMTGSASTKTSLNSTLHGM